MASVHSGKESALPISSQPQAVTSGRTSTKGCSPDCRKGAITNPFSRSGFRYFQAVPPHPTPAGQNDIRQSTASGTRQNSNGYVPSHPLNPVYKYLVDSFHYSFNKMAKYTFLVPLPSKTNKFGIMDALLKETVNAVVNSRYPGMALEGRKLIEEILIRKEVEKETCSSTRDKSVIILSLSVRECYANSIIKTAKM